MLCNVIYQGPSKQTEYHDYINIIYRDLITQKKELLVIEDPEFVIYEVKEEFRSFRVARQFLPLEQLIPHKIQYRNLFKEIANIAGEPYITYYKQHTSRKDRQQLFKYPYVLGADIPIETYYRVLWNDNFKNDARKEPTCIFLDIEVNQKHWNGVGIPRKGEVPIDAVTVVDDVTSTAYTFLLHTKDNPLVDDFLNNQEDFQRQLHEMFDESYPGFTYNQYMFDDELGMIMQIFTLIHSLKRDFCLIWNMSFDIQYIIERIRNLGSEPTSIMCHSDFPTTTLYYYEDHKTFDFDKKRDYFDISCYTAFLDQMIMYASLRKSQGAQKRVNLDAVGRREVGDTKLTHNDLGTFAEFSYTNYVLYVLYNIKDVLLQTAINRKCRDVFNYYNSCYNSFCQYKDGLKQTVSLSSFIYEELLKKNLILGNNINFDNYTESKKSEDADSENDGENTEEDGFDGAINGNPELNDYAGLEMFGKPSKYLFGASIDMDFSAMYPNSICTFNIFANTMIGKLYIEGAESSMNYDDDAGKEFVEDIVAKNVVFIGSKWFGMPDAYTIEQTIASELGYKPISEEPITWP